MIKTAERYRGERVVVTGGAGFIGGRLTEALLAGGALVTVVDDLSTGDADFLTDLMEQRQSQLRFVHASVLEPEALDDAMERAMTVFHLAGYISAADSLHEPERCFAVNAHGTVRVAEAARIAGARRVVLASTAAVYGLAPDCPTGEDAGLAPATPYAGSKLAAEAVVQTYDAAYGVSGVCLRFFNVFGPRQRGDDEGGVVAKFLQRVRGGRRPIVFGDGSQTRDFVHVDDAARALLLAGDPERKVGGAINVGAGRSVEIVRLARLIAEAAGRPDLEPEHTGPRAGDPARSCAATARAGAMLGFEAEIPLEDGLRSMANTPGAVRSSRDRDDGEPRLRIARG